VAAGEAGHRSVPIAAISGAGGAASAAADGGCSDWNGPGSITQSSPARLAMGRPVHACLQTLIN